MQTQQLLKCAIPLIKTHGFTRQTLSLAALSLPKPHAEPLSDTAITALFGKGDDARRTLLDAWLAEGKDSMEESKQKTLSTLLKHRLRWNDPVLQLLPEAFAMTASPSSFIPPLNIRPALRHSFSVADQACYISGDKSTGNAWYAKRITLSAAYSAAELHQLGSPNTADSFLDDLLRTAEGAESALSDTAQFAQFVGRSWLGIYRSLGL